MCAALAVQAASQTTFADRYPTTVPAPGTTVGVNKPFTAFAESPHQTPLTLMEKTPPSVVTTAGPGGP
jgi:hypothetical protein